MKLKIKEGQRFGKLTIVKETEKRTLPSGQSNRFFLCKCDCGELKEVRLVHLNHGRTISCGCVPNPYGGDSKYRLWKIWNGMRIRCSEKAHGKNEKNYFLRGIRVCEEWSKWDSFKEWSINNGYGDTLFIDRIDNNGNYEPSNCRWVTMEVNSNNRNNTFFVNYRGKKEPLKPLLRGMGKEDVCDTIRARILAGWEHNEAIDTEIRPGNYFRGKRGVKTFD